MLQGVSLGDHTRQSRFRRQGFRLLGQSLDCPKHVSYVAHDSGRHAGSALRDRQFVCDQDIPEGYCGFRCANGRAALLGATSQVQSPT